MVSLHETVFDLLQDTVGEEIEVVYDKLIERASVPCVSYTEISNISTLRGDTLQYSSIVFQIKVWSKSIEEIINITEKIDDTLRNAGFRRQDAMDTIDGEYLCKILRYEATGKEEDD